MEEEKNINNKNQSKAFSSKDLKAFSIPQNQNKL